LAASLHAAPRLGELFTAHTSLAIEMGACFSTATLIGLAANILQQQDASMVAQPAAQVTPAIAVNYLQQFYSDGIYGWVL